MARTLRLALAAAIGATASVGYAAPASACSCFGSTELANDATLAANASLVMADFCGGDRDSLTVTVDGQPAQFEGMPEPAGWGEPFLTGITPQPAVGQLVEVTFGNPEFTEPAVRSLEVVDADVEPPSAPEVHIDVNADPTLLSCGGPAEEPHAMQVTLTELDDPGVRYVVTATGDGEPLFSRTVGRFFTQTEISITELQGETFGDFREVCVDVTAIDAAGNEAEPVSNCEAGVGATGCSCSAGDRTPPAWSALAMLGLLGLRRGRRRR